MKRSTLTLSILTALLVSACGGSSSNDEQTKDPTPPKVTPTTPTNPSTPSTGKTPTTGNKDNAGSSAGSSSSSSSDPTPPISSGSAPSGGKPIVVNPSKTDEHTDDGDEDEEKKKKDEDKPVTADDIKALQDALDKTTAEVNELTAKAGQQKATKLANLDALNDKLTVIKGSSNNGLNINENGARLETIKTTLDRMTDKDSVQYKTNKKLYDEALGLEKTWLEAKAEERKIQRELETAKEKQIKETQDLDLAKAKQALAAAEILSEKEYAQAMENEANLKADHEKQKLDAEKLKTQVKKDGEIDQDISALKLKQKDLAAALGLNGISPEQQKDLTGKKKKVDDEIKALEDKKTEQENQKKLLAPKVQIAQSKADAATTTVNNAKTIAQNRGVSGVKGYSEKSLVDIIKAEQNEGRTSWKITFADAPDDPVTIDMSASNSLLSTDISDIKDTDGSTVLGKSGKINDKNAAYVKPSKDSTTSIYGYVNNDKFYSVGVTSDKDKVEKITSVDNVTYNGKALLKDKDGKDMIATFVGNADFGGKTFGGGFSGFASYKPGENATAITTNPALKDPIGFAAKIEGNKFMTTTKDEKKANVYGFFYGFESGTSGNERPTEVGGLVEFKEFHGSFGGAK